MVGTVVPSPVTQGNSEPGSWGACSEEFLDILAQTVDGTDFAVVWPPVSGRMTASDRELELSFLKFGQVNSMKTKLTVVRHRAHCESGRSLIETLIVCLIAAILLAFTVPQVLSARR